MFTGFPLSAVIFQKALLTPVALAWTPTGKAIQAANERDFEIAKKLETVISALIKKPRHDLMNVFDQVVNYEDLRLGEVTRHFDSNTTASIQGWLTHDLIFGGSFAGARLGGIGGAMGQLGLGGTSQARLDLTLSTEK